MNKCPYCSSIRVCWNWWSIGGSDHWDTEYGHECWACGRTHTTEYKVRDGVPYGALKSIEDRVRLGYPEEYTEQMRILFGEVE